MRRPLLLHPSRHGTLIKPSGEKNDRKSRPGLWLSALRSQVSAHADPISRSALACDGLSAPRCVPACPNSANRHISRHSQFIPDTRTDNISGHIQRLDQTKQTMAPKQRRNYSSAKENKSSAFWLFKPPKTLFTCEKYQRVTH